MLVYLAWCDNMRFAEMLEWHNILSSFYHCAEESPQAFHDKYKFRNHFMDCWAFSAWSLGSTIDIHQYSRFCVKNKHLFTVYAHLDDKNSEAQTMKNLEIMEKDYGLNPLPVWHAVARNYKLLEEMLEKYDYIAIGAMAGEWGQDAVLTNTLRTIFKMALKHWKNPDGTMKKRFHAFWWTGTDWLLAFPWYSADSSSWLGGWRFGTIPFWDDKKHKIRNMHSGTKWEFDKYMNYLPKEYRDINLLTDVWGGRNYKNRLLIAIDTYWRMEKYVTSVWKARGITF